MVGMSFLPGVVGFTYKSGHSRCEEVNMNVANVDDKIRFEIQHVIFHLPFRDTLLLSIDHRRNEGAPSSQAHLPVSHTHHVVHTPTPSNKTLIQTRRSSAELLQVVTTI